MAQAVRGRRREVTSSRRFRRRNLALRLGARCYIMPDRCGTNHSVGRRNPGPQRARTMEECRDVGNFKRDTCVMANFRRVRPRLRTHNSASKNTHFLNWTPAWWDILFHRRPRRRAESRLLIKVMKGADPDGLAWPRGNTRPQHWYW